MAGALGWVQGGLEIAAQIASGLLPVPDRIYVPTVTGVTVAGLVVGLSLAELRLPVVALDLGGRLPIPVLHRLSLRLQHRLFSRSRLGQKALSLGPIEVQRVPSGLPSDHQDLLSALTLPHDLPLDSITTRLLCAVRANREPSRLLLCPSNGWPLAPLLERSLVEVPASLKGLLRV